VLVLVGVHGLSYEQVAAICRCEVGTVKSRVNRARNLLKRMLIEGDLPLRRENLPVRALELARLAAEGDEPVAEALPPSRRRLPAPASRRSSSHQRFHA
jgi:hypothetical protein